jgi:hypothetical protein
MNKNIIPKHLLIETICGYCTARCIMCDIEKWMKKPYIMNQQQFEAILSKFQPYVSEIPMLSLFWRGEPLLDHGLILKIRAAKQAGFKSVGFSTNCTELTTDTSIYLLDAGLDCLIVCIDGATKETHEAIRVGTNFEEVVRNVHSFLRIRDADHSAGNSSCKVIFRYLWQQSNTHELPAFKAYWEPFINPSMGDSIEPFPVVNHQDMVKEYQAIDMLSHVSTDSLYCKEMNERMVVTARGDVVLCCADGNDEVVMGNVWNTDPIEIFNCDKFSQYRQMMDEGCKHQLHICDQCTSPRSHKMRDSIETVEEVIGKTVEVANV